MTDNRVWFDIENVPSGGITYPEGFKISITPYSFGDIINITRAPETGTGALDKILEGIKCSFNKDLLLPQDIWYLGLYRKLVSTKHSKIEFSVDCPMCAAKNKKVMDLTELKFKEVRIPELPIVTEINKKELEFVPITVGTYREISRHHKSDASWLLAGCVQNMDIALARGIIANAIAIDKEVLDEITDLLDFGLKPIEFECCDEYCKNMISVQLEDPATLVFPFRSDGESVKNHIKFGTKSSSKCKGHTES